MANIGTTTAFYKVETSLTRANNEVSKSMERLATGKQNLDEAIGSRAEPMISDAKNIKGFCNSK